MLIESISLQNFRNHTSYHLDCKPDTTLILGKNGCGKTSVLEAIYILTQGKSFRATDPDILKRNTSYYRIELKYDTGECIIATYDGKTKTFVAKAKKTKRLPSKNKYPIVLFLPSDLNLVTGSPSRHREYFDRFFSVLSSEYATAISKYEKALRQRNKLLKEDYLNQSAIFPWNILLAKNGTIISDLRKKIVKDINNSITSTYRSIAENQDEIHLDYSTDLDRFTENEYLNLLEKNFEKDRILGHTSFGIHKDNYEFIFNRNSASSSASRGETRSIILALKFIEAHMITEELNQKPIILLDDVFSELDNKRREALVNNFKNHQVIITSVEKYLDN